MSILYDEGQQAIANESRRVLEARCSTDRMLGLLDRVGEYDAPFRETAVEQGWTALAIPEAFGGLGLGLVELGLVAQASGEKVAGAPFLGVGHAAAAAIEMQGTDALKAEWLGRIAAGTALGTIAFAEGTEILPALPETTFADGRLHGAKHGVTGGGKADFAIVWASCDGAPCLVLTGLGDAVVTPIDSYDNTRCHADLAFAGAPAVLLAQGRDARRLAMELLARVAVVLAHEQLGGAEALLFTARDYALTRRAFGQPIGAFQSVKHRIAEMYGLVEIARANAIHAAASVGTPGFLLAAADARLSATEAYDTCARDCVQIHGGIGATWEQGLHLHMRRARSLAIEAGSTFFWEDVLVGELTGEAA
ncbi:acyl-CoA dehydrogenase family protein [Novosphingobium sp. KCTC 2891]|uniref:acyl-CoA dehydrogenase family protein n=1 Tax=Novosphingobium sp. KCTC 2891 TaxID=2989730 RepID=UPI002222E749|nr:acyl-CoA dehydrogenase family protein [Novosphingobium sp. KCTC 2891]MCW1383631.1 acyl-CoA dehydrogenase family protein [Novosphingobium sp. KCTC 2891]